MEDKKVISVRKLAVIERAKALGIPLNKPETSELERQAREWKGREEAKKAEDQSQASNFQGNLQEAESVISDPASGIRDEGDVELGMWKERSYHSPSGSKISANESEIHEGFDWKPYRSEQGEGEKKSKNLNNASVSRIARKIMSREWAAALGSRSPDNGQVIIEREAEKQRQKKAAEKENKEIEEQRTQKQRTALESALRVFGRNLLNITEPVNPEAIETLLENTLNGIGEIISMSWEADGCRILIEPWDEKKLRKEMGETSPVVFETIIDDSMNIASYQKMKDPDMIRQFRNDMHLKRILNAFKKSSLLDILAFEDAIAEGGRIIQSMKMNGGWKIKFEPWEEMRKRNIERKGRLPVVTCVIKADKGFNNISCKRI